MNKQELQEKHGTPAQFEGAVWKACWDLFITYEEAVKAIADYKAEWEAVEES